MIKKSIVALGVTAMLAGCATPPKEIAPTYVSTGLYENLSCKQLRGEAEAVSARAAQAYGAQDKARSQDAAMTGVSLILFWPAAFFLKGDGATAAEVARLKGEMQAIEQVNRVKNCGITFAAV
ncbi:hypothetical protein PSC71_09220 [Devosia sp. J2-20]|jgi:hypothetical protein|uniref:hypothetical protein n=1 Tax=Devosia sp. J2-20 TaxID=3026161 RepID=UPI00249C522E|nr:hypothetical protein [Devosia sp. J2-20]WDR00893.1 hypothetical protein PSC71_09220 [Devosia sp. J2-20]